MKRHTRASLALLVLSVTSWVFGLDEPCSRSDVSGAMERLDGDVVRVALGSAAVERITGENARNRLRALIASNPAAFEQSQKRLRRLGWTPTEEVFVERSMSRIGNRDAAQPSFGLVQDHSEQNADGEILFWSWTDGDDSTWEGSIYVEIYSNGAASLWDGQIDASTSEHAWVWYEKSWERPARERPRVRFSAPPIPGSAAQVVHFIRDDGRQLELGIMPAASFYRWAVCWRAAVVGGCTTAAIACRLSGPAWPACWAAWCIGAEVGGAIACYLSSE